jgi:hypothetical protein
MRLQTTPRTGWVRSGVREPESIADHMYRMSIMAMTMAGSTEYDQQRLIKLAIVHDLAEAIVGDIAPSDNVSKEDKHQREAAALEKIVAMLGASTAAAQEILELWCAHGMFALHATRTDVAMLRPLLERAKLITANTKVCCQHRALPALIPLPLDVQVGV